MIPTQRERMMLLCEKIAKEQNQNMFFALIDELDDLLKREPSKMASEQAHNKSTSA